jgi:MYXO-CTERM domain-containing protein
LLALAFGGSARAQECTSDDDCDDGFECDLGPVAQQDCPPRADGAPDAGACDSTPMPRHGECEPRKMTCETDADCVKGLKCDQHASDVDCAVPASADGGAPEQVDCGAPEPSPGECVLELVGCEKDSDCDEGLECAPIGKTTTCDANGSTCMPGQECTPPKESCTETVNSFCFPPPVACANDDDCDDGKRCVTLPDSAKKNPPPGWEGKSALCLPEVFALALEGRVEFEGGGGSRSEDASSDAVSSGDSKSAGRGASGAAHDGSDEATTGEDTDFVKGMDDRRDDSGCAVSTTGTAGSGAWMLFGVAALWLRRRSTR